MKFKLLALLLIICFLSGCTTLKRVIYKPPKDKAKSEEAFAMDAPTEKGLDIEYKELTHKASLLREEAHHYWVDGKKYRFSREYWIHEKTGTEFLVNKVGDVILAIQPMREERSYKHLWDVP